jgi:hypothetical protein
MSEIAGVGSLPELDSVRASDSERDAAAGRLQAAFAEGRLNDAEFDERMRTALTARTRADLARLMTDLPADAPAALSAPAGSQPGRFAVTFKSSLHHGQHGPGRPAVAERTRRPRAGLQLQGLRGGSRPACGALSSCR